MKGWLKWGAATLALAAAIHLAVVIALPYVLAALFLRRIARTHHGPFAVNQMMHGRPTKALPRNVVMPSPDILYSLCIYDVGKKPLRIIATVPDAYWSLSMYAYNTDNFFVLNDRQAASNRVEVVLAGPTAALPDVGEAEVVIAPTRKGLIAIRIFVADEQNLEALMAVQQEAACSPVDCHD